MGWGSKGVYAYSTTPQISNTKVIPGNNIIGIQGQA